MSNNKTKKIHRMMLLLLLIPVIVFADFRSSYSSVKGSANKTILNYIMYDSFMKVGEDVPYGFSLDNTNQIKIDSGYIKGGLLNIDEFRIAGGLSSYLYDAEEYWTMTSSEDGTDHYAIYNKDNGYVLFNDDESYAYRLAEYILKETKVKGDGSFNYPWYFSNKNPNIYIDLADGYFRNFAVDMNTSLSEYDYIVEA